MMIDERAFDPVTSRADNVRTIMRGGRVRQTTFFTRLFGFTELRDWLLAAGFRAVEGYDGTGNALTAASTRMILVASS